MSATGWLLQLIPNILTATVELSAFGLHGLRAASDRAIDLEDGASDPAAFKKYFLHRGGAEIGDFLGKVLFIGVPRDSAVFQLKCGNRTLTKKEEKI